MKTDISNNPIDRAGELNDSIIALCKEKGLSGKDIFVIGAIVNDEDALERFGEVEALEIAIDAIKRSKDVDDVFKNVTTDLEVFNDDVDIVVDTK